MVTISKAEGRQAVKRLESFKARLANIRKSAERSTEKMLRTAETGGAAFTMGVIQGKTGGVEIVGVPIDLGLGLTLNVLGYFGAAGKMSDHLNNVGDGCLAAYLTTVGRGVGQNWGQKGSLSEKSSGVSLTPEEIAQVAARR
jgi:hypothetical protein